VLIGQRLRELREAKKLSQGDIERRTGLFRCYTSRVENGHTVPSLETLEKYAQAFEIPLYQLYYDGEEPPKLRSTLSKSKTRDDAGWGSSGKDAHTLDRFRMFLGRMDEKERKLLLSMAQKMAQPRRAKH
jgi:transcriptional regulator with XRE-family HTH domain